MPIHPRQLMTNDVHHFGPVVQIKEMSIAGVEEMPILVVINQPEEDFVNELETQASSEDTVISHEEINHQGVGNHDGIVVHAQRETPSWSP
jgi:hypothetical protein